MGSLSPSEQRERIASAYEQNLLLGHRHHSWATPATYTVNSATTITTTVPTGATTGPITVTTRAGTAISATPFAVTQPGIGGFVTHAGSPVAGASVEIYVSSGNLVGSVSADNNGWYLWKHKQTASPCNSRARPAPGVSQG